MRARADPVLFLVLFIVLSTVKPPKLAAQYPQPGPERVYAIKAGKLVDPEKGTTETNQIILVRGKKIEAVGANVTIPADAKVIDLSKSTVLPGLFDAHTHLCMTLKKDRDGNSYFITTLLDPTPYRAIEGVANARDMLAAGFTTVRDVGNAGNYADTALREAIERGACARPHHDQRGAHHRSLRRAISFAARKARSRHAGICLRRYARRNDQGHP